MPKIKIVECPRDAMQGLHDFIPTEQKINYINALLSCDFDTIDFGSFVSPKAIPQMRDTAEVLKGLNMDSTSKLLAIVANERGATDAAAFDEIHYLGYPFSISEQFQRRNTNTSIEDSLHNLEKLQSISVSAKKELVVYLSMGFGNPYGEEWNTDLVLSWSERLHKEFGVNILALSDTIGCANPADVRQLFPQLIEALPNVEFGAHFHTVREKAMEIISAAYEGGCRRFDTAIKGFGGCPMAKDELTGNLATEQLISWLNGQQMESGLNMDAFQTAFLASSSIFNS
ncbi:MAG: hydroxymethylglutaryl-CoA lyase [Flavobacteriales bacterium]